jgi:hypothetical protein
MHDWRERREARPWMLVNTAEALRAAGQEAEGAECSQHALEMEPDGGTRLHRLLLVADAACGGDIDLAKTHRGEIGDVATLDADYQFLVKLIDVMIELAEAADAEKGRAFRAARRQIKAACQDYAIHLPHEPARQRYLAAAQRRIAIQSGKWWAWICHYWDRYVVL